MVDLIDLSQQSIQCKPSSSVARRQQEDHPWRSALPPCWSPPPCSRQCSHQWRRATRRTPTRSGSPAARAAGHVTRCSRGIREPDRRRRCPAAPPLWCRHPCPACRRRRRQCRQRPASGPWCRSCRASPAWVAAWAAAAAALALALAAPRRRRRPTA